MASPSPLLDCGINLDINNLVVICLYFALFIPGLLLNLMAVWISWKLKTKSSFVVYLKNLVAADLLMTLIIPLRAADWLPGSPQNLQAFNCQFGSVLFYLCMYVSIVLMGIISLDRFVKIVKPANKQLWQSAFFGKVVCAVVWMGLLSVTTIPTIALTSGKPEKNNTAELCMAMKSKLGRAYHQGVGVFCNWIFLLVLIIIGLCYTCIARKVISSYRSSGSTNREGKQRVTARVFIVLVVFLVCFAPYHITRVVYAPKQVDNTVDCHWALLKVAKNFTLWLATTNVCLDPLIYFLLCKAFREKLYELKILRLPQLTTATPRNTEETCV